MMAPARVLALALLLLAALAPGAAGQDLDPATRLALRRELSQAQGSRDLLAVARRYQRAGYAQTAKAITDEAAFKADTSKDLLSVASMYESLGYPLHADGARRRAREKP